MYSKSDDRPISSTSASLLPAYATFLTSSSAITGVCHADGGFVMLRQAAFALESELAGCSGAGGREREGGVHIVLEP